jgi:hypothetical protein
MIRIFRFNLYMNYIKKYYSVFGLNVLKMFVYGKKNINILYCR